MFEQTGMAGRPLRIRPIVRCRRHYCRWCPGRGTGERYRIIRKPQWCARIGIIIAYWRLNDWRAERQIDASGIAAEIPGLRRIWIWPIVLAERSANEEALFPP